MGACRPVAPALSARALLIVIENASRPAADGYQLGKQLGRAKSLRDERNRPADAFYGSNLIVESVPRQTRPRHRRAADARAHSPSALADVPAAKSTVDRQLHLFAFTAQPATGR
jgi:hypothetical protein